jgi:plasmid stabilization system protein ParE
MKEIELTPKAEEDLEAIWDWLQTVRDCSGGCVSAV